MNLRKEKVEEVRTLYRSISDTIESRLSEFQSIWEKGTDDDIFTELVFCLLTPQSKAKNSWKAVGILKTTGLMMKGGAEELSEVLNIVRFKNNKARYIIEARERFMERGKPSIRDELAGFDSSWEMREWLVATVKGIGYKEASHFLRNIGHGDALAILDRHILKNLILIGVIDDIPKSLSKKKYIEIEQLLISAAKKIGILPGHLDLLLWYKETGEVFK